ncbi:hypothetical protein SAMN05421819_4164 [Bryocella elongata]|uniref:Uncharacterized protein n=1 Tax=Bryocella elongata TaxID=863522 RepID=A0A1H6C1L2_9BACT|nr:hypothetical protein SAMN05421819_4164 [Bryocella elongata]
MVVVLMHPANPCLKSETWGTWGMRGVVYTTDIPDQILK